MPEVTKEVGITRMDCPTCVLTLEKSVMKVPGVMKAQGNYLKRTIKVTMEDTVPLTAIEKAIEDVGYQVAYKKYPGPLSKIRDLFSRGESKAITSITDDDFQQKVLKAGKSVVVLFSSEGCPACQIIKPQFKALAVKHARADFYEMDVTNTEKWKDYNIMGIPTVIVFRDGKPEERFGTMFNFNDMEKVLNG